MQERLITIEKTIEKMAISIEKLVSAVNRLNIVEENTARNTHEIDELKKSIELKEEKLSNVIDNRSTGNNRRYDDVVNVVKEMDKRMDVRGDSRLKWGLGIALMTTFTLYGTAIGIMSGIKEKVQEQSVQTYHLNKKVEEINNAVNNLQDKYYTIPKK